MEETEAVFFRPVLAVLSAAWSSLCRCDSDSGGRNRNLEWRAQAAENPGNGDCGL